MGTKNTKQIQYGIYLAYRPVYLASGNFESFIVYIINYDITHLDLSYEHKINQTSHFNINTLLEKEAFHELGIVSCEDCNETQLLTLNASLNNNKKIKVQKKILPKVFFNSFSKIPFVEKDGILILLYQKKKSADNTNNKPMTITDVEKIRAQLMGGNLKESKNIISDASDVIDLHWDKLGLKFPSVLKDGVFEHQMQVFEKELDVAIAEGKTSITFIHGLGTGKLKNAIFAYLASHPCVERYNNDYHQRYGYGATKVLLKLK